MTEPVRDPATAATRSRASPPIISLVVPFFNEGCGVELFWRAICLALEGIPDARFEFVFIDDGSADDTLSRLIALSLLDPRVRVLELSRNFGKEAALTAGLSYAAGDAVVPLDADLQDPPALIARMIEEWRKGADVVLARRVDRSSDSFLKRKTASMFYRLHNRLSTITIPDNVGDFRLMDREVVEAIKLLPERQRFMKGLFAWVGYRTTTIDYIREPRGHGSSKFSGWKLWNFALEGITSFSTAPLKVWTYLGMAGASITLCYTAFVVYQAISHQIDVPGYASLLAATLFFGSLQLISIGLLGEYIGRIYLESKGRPNYIVRSVHGGQNG